ncbi:TIGR02117 family protein [Pontibacter sp. MBLB2868]|uniref:TIGR02117 family protein n=1 Tax=Pontibacter sp. MBLB2868 TaxID=3451555 RepID=UPI003F756B19
MLQWTLKLLTSLVWALCTIVGLTVVFFVAGFLLSSIPVNSSFAQSADENAIEIFVTSNGVHTDLVIPVVTPYIDWRSKIPLHHFENVDSTYAYVSFGWGDRRFYMQTPEWSDITPEVAITAALWPTRTAMHVEYIQSALASTRRQIPVRISPEQYQKLIKYIDSSFQENEGNYMHIQDSGYTFKDTFYEARGKFCILKNCNSWVNSGLKSMGVKAALWAPFPYAIMRHLR